MISYKNALKKELESGHWRSVAYLAGQGDVNWVDEKWQVILGELIGEAGRQYNQKLVEELIRFCEENQVKPNMKAFAKSLGNTKIADTVWFDFILNRLFENVWTRTQEKPKTIPEIANQEPNKVADQKAQEVPNEEEIRDVDLLLMAAIDVQAPFLAEAALMRGADPNILFKPQLGEKVSAITALQVAYGADPKRIVSEVPLEALWPTLEGSIRLDETPEAQLSDTETKLQTEITAAKTGNETNTTHEVKVSGEALAQKFKIFAEHYRDKKLKLADVEFIVSLEAQLYMPQEITELYSGAIARVREMREHLAPMQMIASAEIPADVINIASEYVATPIAPTIMQAQGKEDKSTVHFKADMPEDVSSREWEAAAAARQDAALERLRLERNRKEDASRRLLHKRDDIANPLMSVMNELLLQTHSVMQSPVRTLKVLGLLSETKESKSTSLKNFWQTYGSQLSGEEDALLTFLLIKSADPAIIPFGQRLVEKMRGMILPQIQQTLDAQEHQEGFAEPPQGLDHENQNVQLLPEGDEAEHDAPQIQQPQQPEHKPSEMLMELRSQVALLQDLKFVEATILDSFEEDLLLTEHTREELNQPVKSYLDHLMKTVPVRQSPTKGETGEPMSRPEDDGPFKDQPTPPDFHR